MPQNNGEKPLKLINNSFSNRIKISMRKNSMLFGAALAVLAIFIFLCIASKPFFSQTNLTNVARQSSVLLILGAGTTMVLISGGTDLSIGSNVSLSSVILAFCLVTLELPLALAILVALCAGLAMGLFNGVIINGLGIPSIIATIATMIGYRGVALLITQGYNITIPRTSPLVSLGNGLIGNVVPISTVVVIVIYLICGYVMRFTKYGRILYGMGGNAIAVRLSGISVKKNSIIVYAISGFLAAVAAVIMTGRVVTGSPTSGSGLEMDAIAASVIGGVTVGGGVGNIYATILGVLVIMFIQNGLNLLNVNSYWQIIVQGIVIIFAISVSNIVVNQQKKI